MNGTLLEELNPSVSGFRVNSLSDQLKEPLCGLLKLLLRNSYLRQQGNRRHYSASLDDWAILLDSVARPMSLI